MSKWKFCATKLAKTANYVCSALFGKYKKIMLVNNELCQAHASKFNKSLNTTNYTLCTFDCVTTLNTVSYRDRGTTLFWRENPGPFSFLYFNDFFDAKSYHFNNHIQIIIFNFVHWYLLGH